MNKILLFIMLTLCFVSLSNADNCDEYTKLLLHMEDNNFVDSSQNSYSVIVKNNASVSNDIFKIGEGSAYFDSSQGYLSIQESNDWNFENLDFTIDFWVKIESKTLGGNKFFSIFKDSNNQLFYGLCGSNNDNICGYLRVNSDIYDYGQYANNLLDTKWHHIAIVRKENIIKTYIDGFEKSKVDFTDTFFDGGKVFIGVWFEAQDEHNGYIDEFRISKGIARWFSDFNYDLPSSPYCSGTQENKEILGIVGDINNDGKIDLLETIYSLQVTAGIKPIAIGPYAMAWKGDWKANSIYMIYDAVNFDGSSYICIVNHTSETAKPDIINTNYWEILAKKGEDGQKGESAISVHHEWNGTSIRFQNKDGSWGEWVNLKGDTGIQGATGPQGPQGPQGQIGPSVKSSAICASGAYDSVFNRCDRVGECSCSLTEISKSYGPCHVSSETGECSAQRCGQCCVCSY